MLISHKHRFVFVHVPKTGGDSVTAALKPYATRGLGGETASPEKHLAAWDIRQRYFAMRNWPAYFSFAFVRNPWDWLHSDYWFCISKAPDVTQHPENHVQSWVAKLLRVQKMTFAEFVRSEWTASPCRSYCQEAGRDMVSFIGCYENLQSDFAEVCRQIGLESTPPLEHRNSTIVSGRTRRHYREDYTPELRDLVAKRFAYDIDRFGYDF